MAKKYFIALVVLYFILSFTVLSLSYFFNKINQKGEILKQGENSVIRKESIFKKNTIWINPQVPEIITKAINDLVKDNNFYLVIPDKNKADILVDYSSLDAGNVIYKEYLVPVVGFHNLREEISSKELKEKSDNTVKLVAFEDLRPEMKILKVDGEYILDKDYNDSIIEIYPLIKTFVYPKDSGRVEEAKEFAKIISKKIPSSNRDISKMTTLAMTGVTAISRGVETTIKYKKDPVYPARGIMDKLAKYDLTHIDSENPFFDDCPEVEADALTLCGKTVSIESLKAIGTDIVDLTGNHQNDFGAEKNLESVKHLEDAGFEYFGGGKNEEEAKKILYKEINGTKIAFLGYAYFDSLNGRSYRSLAYGDRPGANFYSEEKIKSDIEEARKNADIVIVDYQFTESYSYYPLPEQKTVFQKTIDAGADLVVGVQSHQPQKIEFYNKGMIFYGLGNLFFDQMWSYPTRQGIIPAFTFYDGQLISVEILTTLLYDYSQPRFTSGEEREKLLDLILPEQTID